MKQAFMMVNLRVLSRKCIFFQKQVRKILLYIGNITYIQQKYIG
jgi:hypothetical protein